MRAFAREEKRHFAADAAAAADHDHHDLAAELGFGGHPLQLRFLERPVFDAERFRARQRDVVVELFELSGLLRSSRLRQRGAGRPSRDVGRPRAVGLSYADLQVGVRAPWRRPSR